MKYQNYSVVAGSEACNARCPFCVSKMTPQNGVESKEPEVNWRNFRIGAQLAKDGGVDTVMITSKGEPTLFPEQISKYMDELQPYQFPLIELQTNGITFAEKKETMKPYLKEWYKQGLTTVAISIVHYDPEKNKEIYTPHKKSYYDLPEVIEELHDIGLSVRLATVAVNGYLDGAGELEQMIAFARENKVEQLTIRPVNKPSTTRNLPVYNWTSRNELSLKQKKELSDHLEKKGTKLIDLPHGGRVYDVQGQNVCLTNCLTLDADPENGRQLIFFPDGHLRYDWTREGAIIL